MSNFKNLLRGYLEAFIFQVPYLVSSRVFIITETRETPSVYKLPYRKSPAESLAIKAELERMLALNINRPRGGGGGGRNCLYS